MANLRTVLPLAISIVLSLTTSPSSAFLTCAPASQDSCRTWIYQVKNSPFFNRLLLSIFGETTCPDDKVVNSEGQCVSLDDSSLNRCLNATVFNQSAIDERCVDKPGMKIANPHDCSSYFYCRLRSMDHWSRCPTGQLFNDVEGKCDKASKVLCNRRPIPNNRSMEEIEELCQNFPTLKTSDPSQCNGYIDCKEFWDHTGRFFPYKRECQYPLMYDADLKECVNETRVNCFQKPMVKYECNLRQNACGRSSHCKGCQAHDCTNDKDGAQQPKNRPYGTTQYVECRGGFNRGVKDCPQGRIFDARDDKRTCEYPSVVPRSYGGHA